jgi:hypothetical protein
MADRFCDHYGETDEDIAKVEAMFEAADRAARSPFDRTFIDNLYEKFEEYGMRTYLSYSQKEQFERIANR